MLDEEMAKEMANTPGSGLGIADILYQQLSRPMIAKRLQDQVDGASVDYGME
jgi:Rod binding domain-containing protein